MIGEIYDKSSNFTSGLVTGTMASLNKNYKIFPMALDFTGTNFYHRTGIQIRFNDIDMLQHVNNTIYQNYFDSARFRYFKQVLGIEKFLSHQWVVLATISIDFVVPVMVDDEIEVQTKITTIGIKSFTMLQQIVAKEGAIERIKTRSSSVLVGYNMDLGCTAPICDEWKSRIRTYEHDTSF